MQKHYSVLKALRYTVYRLVIKLEEWNKNADYDRMGLEEQYTEILGNKVVCHSIPIRPGRNVAIICESAAVNFRQKKMGYNAAKEMYNRVMDNMMNTGREELEHECNKYFVGMPILAVQV